LKISVIGTAIGLKKAISVDLYLLQELI